MDEHAAGVYERSLQSSFTRARFRAQRWLSRPEKIIGLVLLAILAILVVLPLIQIFIGASTFSYNDTRLVRDATPGHQDPDDGRRVRR